MALTLTKPSAERALKSSSSPRRAIMVAASSRISSGSGSPDDDEEEDEDSEVALAGGWHFPQRCVEAAFVQESRLGCPPRPEGARPKTESLQGQAHGDKYGGAGRHGETKVPFAGGASRTIRQVNLHEVLTNEQRWRPVASAIPIARKWQSDPLVDVGPTAPWHHAMYVQYMPRL